jgi:hypothetical protein
LKISGAEDKIEELDKIDMVDIYRVYHSKTRQHTFFSAAYGTFSKIDNNLG